VAGRVDRHHADRQVGVGTEHLGGEPGHERGLARPGGAGDAEDDRVRLDAAGAQRVDGGRPIGQRLLALVLEQADQGADRALVATERPLDERVDVGQGATAGSPGSSSATMDSMMSSSS
jgi:hypothetical protein